MSSAEARAHALQSLRALHDDIDREARILEKRHADRLECRRGCAACCLDDLTVTRIEAERIRDSQAKLLAAGQPHPKGACAFLDEDRACRIYDDRPSVCRSQGLPLRILFENEAGEIEERRDVCSLNFEEGPTLDSLDEDDCWLVGAHELRLMQLDDEAFGSKADGERIALRALFRRKQT